MIFGVERRMRNGELRTEERERTVNEDERRSVMETNGVADTVPLSLSVSLVQSVLCLCLCLQSWLVSRESRCLFSFCFPRSLTDFCCALI